MALTMREVGMVSDSFAKDASRAIRVVVADSNRVRVDIQVASVPITAVNLDYEGVDVLLATLQAAKKLIARPMKRD